MSYHLLLSQMLLRKHFISLNDTGGLQWAADKGKAERISALQDTWMMMGFGFCWSQTTGDFSNQSTNVTSCYHTVMPSAQYF